MAKWSAQELVERLQIPHEGTLYSSRWMVEFSEGASSQPDWHIVRLDLSNFIGIRARIEIEFIADRCAPKLYLGKNGGRDLGFIGVSSESVDVAGDATINLSRSGAALCVTLDVLIDDGFLLIGGCSENGERIYTGRNTRVFSIASISARDAALDSKPELTVLDIGASGGLDPMWEPYSDRISFALVEPDPVGAAALREGFAAASNVSILEAALAGEDGARTLNITEARACSSLLEPDTEALGRYAVAPLFRVAERLTVDCKRYDGLVRDGAPVPDFVKLDTQGTELEILRGFGELLNGVSGIKLEAHFYSIYVGQPTVGEVVAYLDQYGFTLREMTPCWSFDADLVEVDCLFMRRVSEDTADDVRAKVAMLSDIFRLPERPLGAELASAFR